jgi:hypothetical protein
MRLAGNSRVNRRLYGTRLLELNNPNQVSCKVAARVPGHGTAL